jgi:hypothetical protein
MLVDLFAEAIFDLCSAGNSPYSSISLDMLQVVEALIGCLHVKLSAEPRILFWAFAIACCWNPGMKGCENIGQPGRIILGDDNDVPTTGLEWNGVFRNAFFVLKALEFASDDFVVKMACKSSKGSVHRFRFEGIAGEFNGNVSFFSEGLLSNQSGVCIGRVSLEKNGVVATKVSVDFLQVVD